MTIRSFGQGAAGQHWGSIAAGLACVAAVGGATPAAASGAGFVGGSITISGSAQSGQTTDEILVPGEVAATLISAQGEAASGEVTANAAVDGYVTESVNGTIVVLLSAFAEAEQPIGSNGFATITAATVNEQLLSDPIVFELCEPLMLQFEKTTGLGAWSIELTPLTGEILEGEPVYFQPGTYELSASTSATIEPGQTSDLGMLFFCVTLVPVQGQCPGDIAPASAPSGIGDGQVGAGDLAAVLAAWGACPACGGCLADISPPATESAQAGDGVVNAADLAELLAHWGDCR